MNALLRLVHWLVAKPWLYNVAQTLAGAETVRRHLRPRLQETSGKLVLDVGAGTGLYLSCFPVAVPLPHETTSQNSL